MERLRRICDHLNEGEGEHEYKNQTEASPTGNESNNATSITASRHTSSSGSPSLWIKLCKEKTLNSLDEEMVLDITSHLASFKNELRKESFVVIHSSGERAFCAGGDIRALATAAKEKNYGYPSRFFSNEFKLDETIATYSVPVVCIIKGICMGGGVGLMIGATYRVVTDKLVFAMPETGIGYFPDVGGCYYLPRLPGNLGMYIGLTGFRLTAADALYCGIATHVIKQELVPELEKELQQADSAKLDEIIAKYSVTSLDTLPPSQLKINRQLIDQIFSANKVENILIELEKSGSEWALSTLATLRTKCPLSLKVTHECLTRGSKLSLRNCLEMEFIVAMRFMQTKDYYEGVRAVVLDKDNKPRYSHCSVHEVSDADVAPFFAPLPPSPAYISVLSFS